MSSHRFESLLKFLRNSQHGGNLGTTNCTKFVLCSRQWLSREPINWREHDRFQREACLPVVHAMPCQRSHKSGERRAGCLQMLLRGMFGIGNCTQVKKKTYLLPTLGLACRVVLDLLDDARLKNKGYRVFLDNFYSSPTLLLEEGFEACGTLRSNRKRIPRMWRSQSWEKGRATSARMIPCSLWNGRTRGMYWCRAHVHLEEAAHTLGHRWSRGVRKSCSCGSIQPEHGWCGQR